ncbi:Beta-lactamase [Bosea sp. LC85]|uniref:serine hydrolase domain-containing protein n=1 Tax=Bosea sp. LC85 TaxID=1502851 RepID=UPI0004E394E3|nr:serine hydrolase [Bosea sp. LC85]KFC69341.1 Beta-lactamase [Bosea sp. LC85]
MSMDSSTRARIERFYDGTLLPDEMVATMSTDGGWFPSRTIARAPMPSVLERSGQALPPLAIQDHGTSFDLYDYLSVNRVAGLMVLRDGAVVEESYSLGIGPQTMWNSCSLAKSVAATLVGIALREGAIESLDDPVTRYAPLGGVYAQVSIRQLLRMVSGIRWREAYTDPTSDRRQLLEIQTQWQKGGIARHMATLPAATAPGQSWTYNTGESYLVSAVMEGATGTNLADYLSTRLWSRMGAEADATWWSESPDGMTVSGSGMHATMRDYARFGQFVLDGGRIGGETLLPEGWTGEAGSPFLIGETLVPYGYMWWIPVLDDPALKGTFQAEGIYGQYIHINPHKRLVVVVLSARSKPSYRQRLEIKDDAFFAALARAL